MDNWTTGQKCLVHLQQGSKHAKKPLGPIKKMEIYMFLANCKVRQLLKKTLEFLYGIWIETKQNKTSRKSKSFVEYLNLFREMSLVSFASFFRKWSFEYWPWLWVTIPDKCSIFSVGPEKACFFLKIFHSTDIFRGLSCPLIFPVIFSLRIFSVVHHAVLQKSGWFRDHCVNIKKPKFSRTNCQ